MVEAYITAAALGLLLGLRYRAAAAVAMSALVLVAGTPVAMLAGWSFWMAVVAGFGAACVLQFGYLAGLLLGAAIARTRPQERSGDDAATALGEARARTP
jgi:hypothetical protein